MRCQERIAAVVHLQRGEKLFGSQEKPCLPTERHQGALIQLARCSKCWAAGDKLRGAGQWGFLNCYHRRRVLARLLLSITQNSESSPQAKASVSGEPLRCTWVLSERVLL